METTSPDKNLCRICLQPEAQADHLSIFGDNRKSAFGLKIFLISGVQVCCCYKNCLNFLMCCQQIILKVIENRDNPASICNQCVKDLLSADLLRLKCLQADKYFRSMIPAEFFQQAVDVMTPSRSGEDPVAQYLWNHHLTAANVKEETRDEFETVFAAADLKSETESNDSGENEVENIFAESSEEKISEKHVTVVKSKETKSKKQKKNNGKW